VQQVVNHFAEALHYIDQSGERFKSFQPGAGPWGEPQLVRRAIAYLRCAHPEAYGTAQTKREPDVLIPGRWALEFKIVRPYGDNGKEAEHWSQNLLHPYVGNVSSLGDAMKLLAATRTERNGLIVFAFEHASPSISLEVLVRSFELVAREVLAIPLGVRRSARLEGLVHPVHQCATVYGWELDRVTLPCR
jgi:hypothetical protein